MKYIITITIENDDNNESKNNIKDRIEGAVNSLRYVSIIDCTIRGDNNE